MKETNKQLLDQVILGELEWDAREVRQAMSQDPEFAEAIQTASKTLGLLEQHGDLLDDVDLESVPITPEDRAEALKGLNIPRRSPILRHGLWLLPSAAAAVFAFSHIRKEPDPQSLPHNATLGEGNGTSTLPQTASGFLVFEFGDTLDEGMFARMEVFASDSAVEPLFATGQIRDRSYQLSATQVEKLSGYEKVWVIVEWTQAAGHTHSSPGQWWMR